MKYQLVLQFAADSMEDFDRLVALDARLIEELDDVATVDGHDFGSGAFNGGEGEADKSATRQNFFFH
jgi:hypothetical protein